MFDVLSFGKKISMSTFEDLREAAADNWWPLEVPFSTCNRQALESALKDAGFERKSSFWGIRTQYGFLPMGRMAQKTFLGSELIKAALGDRLTQLVSEYREAWEEPDLNATRWRSGGYSERELAFSR